MQTESATIWFLNLCEGYVLQKNRKVIKLMPIGKYESQKSNQLELKASDFV